MGLIIASRRIIFDLKQHYMVLENLYMLSGTKEYL